MSDQLTALITHSASGVLIFAIATAIRMRGPRGLVHGVDWSRVSDMQGLGQFVSTALFVVAALLIARGVAFYALFDNPILRNIVNVVLVIFIALIVLAAVIGVRRYQDQPFPRKIDARR